MAESSRRIQIVFTAPFLILLLLSGGCFAGAYWLYRQASSPPIPPAPAPYYVNRTLTSVRPCYQCIDSAGKLKERQAWKLGKAADIPAGETWWFSPAQDLLNPVAVDGVPMLAVHPAIDKDKPWQGFDPHRVLLVVFQDVEGRATIEHPAPPSAPAPAAPAPETPPNSSPDSSSNGSSAPVSAAPQQ